MKIAIIGSGFAGLAMGIRLKEAGFTDFVIFEKAAEVGGTWRDNHYPGAACDVPSHLYSLSFAQNPNWSRQFAPQSEILEYTLGLVRDYGLDPFLRLSEGVENAVYQPEKQNWRVETSKGVHEFDLVVAATGGLSRWSIPEFKGLDLFSGKVFHTADWQHDVDLKGKKVAVIGTGASAIQVVPEIAKIAGSLDVYMRTPPWIIPRNDAPISERVRASFRRFPKLLEARRASIYAGFESHAIAFFNPKLMVIPKQQCLAFMRKSIAEKELRDLLTPDYLPGCKRVLLSDDFYPAIQKSNVRLVTQGISHFNESGVVDDLGGERRHDVVIMATGFKVSEDVAPFPVQGRYQSLQEVWKERAEAYKGATIAGFPNLFVLVGPNTALGHNSMIYMIESQVNYVLDAVKKMARNAWKTVDVRPEAQRIYNDEIQQKLNGTVWESGCVSWYRTKDGKNTTIWPDFTFKFRAMTREFDEDAYFLERAR